MAARGIDEARSPELSPYLDLEPMATRTEGIAPERKALIRDQVREARPSLFSAVPSDAALSVSTRRRTDFSVLGLGPLPADDSGLRAKATRLARAQGLDEVRHRLRHALEATRQLRATLTGLPDAYPAELERRLHVMDAALADLTAERDRVGAALQPHLLDEAHEALDATLARVDYIEARYFRADGSARVGELSSLREDAKALLQARNDALRAGPGRADAALRYAALHREVSARHPLLASFDLATPEARKLEDLAHDTIPAEEGYMARPLQDPLRGMLADVRASVGEMRARLRDEPGVVWRLPGVVDATLIRHGVPAKGMVAAHAHDLVSENAKDDALLRTFVSLLSVGLGVAAALPSGGTSLAVAATLTTAVDGYQLYSSLEDYRFRAAASGTALDRRRALSSDVPGPGWLALDIAGAAAGAAGTAASLRKSGFTRLLAAEGPAGDMARGLELRLGTPRATIVVDELGEGPAELLFRDLAPETWLAVADAPHDNLRSALSALGADGVRGLERALGADGVAAWTTRVTPGAWLHLAATPLGPQDIQRIVGRFSPEEAAALAPALKGRGLAELAAHLGDAKLTVAADHVLVDGQLRLHPRELLREAQSGALPDLRRRLAALRSKSTSFDGLGPLTPAQLGHLERLADEVAAGPPGVRAPGTLTQHQGRSEALVLRVAREIAGDTLVLGARAEALAQAAPELRAGLEALETSAIDAAMRMRTLDLVEQAVAHREVTISRPHLGRLLESSVHDVARAEAALDSRLLELEYALHVVDSGQAAPGSKVYLGVSAGEQVPLTPGGPVVGLPKPAPGEKGVLQDIDVLFLTKAGEVQAVEVKRSGRALWESFERTKGRYAEKFVNWRTSGGIDEPPRKVAMAVRYPEDGYLDRQLEQVELTPRKLLSRQLVELHELGEG